MLSAVRMLPNEILLHIFQYVCEENLIQNYPWLLDDSAPTKFTSPAITYLPAMVISSVCSHWRELALSSPSLWANMTVETYYASEISEEVGFLDTIARYLERSGDWPSRLALDIQGTAFLRKESSLFQLAQHAHRWKAFKYRGYYPLRYYSMLFHLHFPSLAELYISSFTQLVASSDLDRFEHAPKLRALSTDKVPISRAPYHQLTHLSIQRIGDASEMTEALHRYHSVKSIEIELWEINYDLDEDAQLCTWPNITSLTVRKDHDCSGSEIMMVFFSLSLPSLKELVIEGAGSRCTPWPGEALISFISTSSCTITIFTLRDLSLSDLDIISVLQVMPSLLHLEIDDGEWHNRYSWQDRQSPITSLLISNLAQPQFLPKLRSLRLISHNKSGSFNGRVFVSMVQSRWFRPGSDMFMAMLTAGRGCIRSVVLKFSWREVDAEVYKPLRNLDKEGLRVVVAGTNGIQV
ncbi:hypothetical protein BDP27DRAFT_1333187 [Rhodocollybia butyracea]|uniref:F-box domain-containing protein n=1 Tax=Rhodocollybia butyracea TaxID=206335 RepID=A0A9P5U371_9AGAR|nr:hypothetical protein BDP27DRAFT_1333187 [Rhodocollybia butyracea]